MVKQPGFAILFAACGIVAATGVARARAGFTAATSRTATPSAADKTAAPASFLGDAHRRTAAWTRKLDGWASDLAVARDGSAVLVATIPNQDEGGTGPYRYSVARYDAGGRLEWRVPTPTPLKSLAVSDDGSLAALANYDNQIVGVDRHGKIKWTIDGICKPILLTRRQRILCYHDDDLEPQVAFDLLDWQGKKLASVPIPKGSDVLALRVSRDERNVAFALSGGKVLHTSVDAVETGGLKAGTPPAFKAAGEIVDLAIGDGAEPTLAVLHESPSEGGEPGRALSWYNAEGERLGGGPSPHRAAEEVGISPDGLRAFIYADDKTGQLVAGFARPPAKSSAQKPQDPLWSRGDPKSTEFAFPLTALPDHSVIGALETQVPGTPDSFRTQIVARFGGAGAGAGAGDDNPKDSAKEGHPLWYAPLSRELVELPARLYLYAYAEGEKGRDLLAAATDNGLLSVYSSAPVSAEAAKATRAATEAPKKGAARAPRKKRKGARRE